MSEFEITRSSVLSVQVCTDIADTGEIEARTNQIHPTGISSRWRIGSDPVAEGGDRNPVQCDDHPGRKHYLLFC